MFVPTFQTDRKELKEFFNQFGRAEEVRIKDPGTSKAYAKSLFYLSMTACRIGLMFHNDMYFNRASLSLL